MADRADSTILQPVLLRPSPGFRDFATLGGLEASVRGTLVAVWPLEMYARLGSKASVSWAYFVVGCASLAAGLAVPVLARHIPRRWLYTMGAGLYVIAMVLAIVGGVWLTPLALLAMGIGVVTNQICVNAYLMDYISRRDLGRSETLRMFYSALPWAIGPAVSVTLWQYWQPFPFVIAACASLLMLAKFWQLRMGNGKAITRARSTPPHPLAYLGRFRAQPRLVAGWMFAVMRSSGWWIFVVYLPIFCVEAGLGDRIAGLAFATSSLMLFLAPRMLRLQHRMTLRRSMIAAFTGAAICFALASFGAWWPLMAVGGILAASVFLVSLDAFGSLPFLMAVKPGERTEMSAIFTSFRDVSGILTPGVAFLILLATGSIPLVFLASAIGMAAMALLARRLNPRLGVGPGPRAVAGQKVSPKVA
ncbi:MFS transporter [Paracoccus sp. TK19116]|uniref:MFS transporter n=1 Tax=Paracoccus albicereus TaxID=2922394 RepID=A0ABT1MUM4_9RHOB|nr:MFS transporter [Paracoccus albicereus]MCQ0971389.1 MFS transporter [Paracoccus albicereus]